MVGQVIDNYCGPAINGLKNNGYTMAKTMNID